MIILDTNIISELMKPLPSQQVLSWLDEQFSDRLYITSVSVGEIMYGLHALPKSKRRKDLETAFSQVISEAFNQRSLPFDDNAALVYGKIMAKRKEKGRPMSFCDGQIAAITLNQGWSLATRNIKDFESTEIKLINPFEFSKSH